MKRVFLDASCWMAAAGSPKGGSATILKLARLGQLVVVATQRVLKEAEKNVRLDWGWEELERLHREITDVDPEMVDDPSDAEEACWQAITVPKDCHVLAAAHRAQVDVLVSQDTAHLVTPAVAAGFPIPVMTTKQFFASLTSEDLRAPERAASQPPEAAGAGTTDPPAPLKQAIEAAYTALMILEQSGDTEKLQQTLDKTREVIAAADQAAASDPRWARPTCARVLAAARTAHAELEQQLTAEEGTILLLRKAQVNQAAALEAMKQALLSIPALAQALQKFGKAAVELQQVIDREEML
jgi:predicted nucleic acid-binding protein